MSNSMQAVITGDLVKSTKVDKKGYTRLISTLKKTFQTITSLYSDNDKSIAFDIFRGDSFQGIIPNPKFALNASLIIRSCLRKSQSENSSLNWDARTAIGIGSVDSVPENVSEGTGEAYKYSGSSLDQMKSEQRLTIITPWEKVNNEMRSQTALLDAIMAKWTPPQAEIVFELLQGKPRKAISKEFDISQAAVHYRVKGAGWLAIQKFIERYQNVIKNKISHD